MAQNTTYLIDMVNQLLETYDYEATTYQFNFQKHSIQTLADGVLKQIEGLLSDRQIVVERKFPEHPIFIYADDAAIKRVFLNLLGNALDNTPKGSIFRIIILSQDNNVEIHFIDNGPGVAPDIRDRLFERYTGGAGDTRKIGTGLGLYICKIIIEAHGGGITVESESGIYTDFRIILPLVDTTYIQEH